MMLNEATRRTITEVHLNGYSSKHSSSKAIRSLLGRGLNTNEESEVMFSGGNEEEILRKLDLKVREIMRPSPLTIPAYATAIQAAKAMEKQDSSCVFVESKGKIVGIVTERDITRRVVGNGASPGETKVESVMTSPLIVTSPDTRIEEALNVMITTMVRRLLVVDEKAGLVGLVGVADIAKALAEKAGYTTSLIKAMTKEDLAPTGVYS